MARRGFSKRRSVTNKKKVTARTASARKAAIAPRLAFSIQGNRLVGPGVSFVETPNKGGDLSPRYLVFHYTSGEECCEFDRLADESGVAGLSASGGGQEWQGHPTRTVQREGLAHGHQPLGRVEPLE